MTLIELLVVAAVIAIMAAVAIPKYGELLEKANLGATVGNLASLRSALSIYKANYSGLPVTIDGNIQPAFKKVLGGDTPYVRAKFPDNASPYGNGVTVSADAASMPAGAGTGWFYNNKAGNIYINSTAADIKGESYIIY